MSHRVYLGIDPNWSRLLISYLYEYVDTGDPETYEILYDMTSCYLYWQVLGQRHGPERCMFIADLLQGYGAHDLPHDIFDHMWETLDADILGYLMMFQQDTAIEGISPVNDAFVLQGFLLIME